jgi:hypothetical protein
MSSPSKEGLPPSTVPNQQCPRPNPFSTCLQSNRLSTRQCLFLVALCFGSVLLVALLAGKSHLRHRITSNGAGEYQQFQFHRSIPTQETIDPNGLFASILMPILEYFQPPQKLGRQSSRPLTQPKLPPHFEWSPNSHIKQARQKTVK